MPQADLSRLDCAPFKCPLCHGSFKPSADIKLLTCLNCGNMVNVSDRGIPLFSHTTHNVEGVQTVYHDATPSVSQEARFGSYSCRNAYLDQVFIKPGRLLDLAGSDGVIGCHFMGKGYDVVLVDIVESALENALRCGIKCAGVVDVERPWPFLDNYFDYIFWGDNVEHLFRPLDAMKEVARTLKPGGVLACSFPNMGYWEYRISYLLHGNVPNTEITKKLWERDHIRHFNQNGFIELLLEANLNPQTFLPVIKLGSTRFWRVSHMLRGLSSNLFGQDLLAIAVKPK